MNTISSFIRTKRKEAGWTQREFAAQAGLGLRFVRELEQGKPTLRMDKVAQALRVFGCEPVPGPQDTGLRPALIADICRLARAHDMERIVLFGSRARGDYRRASDIDLAVRGAGVDLFRLAVEEETPTLLTYDVLDLDAIGNAELLANIQREGMILYEKV